MPEKIMTIEELKKLQTAFDETTKTDEPIAIQTESASIVNGDPLKTGSNSPKDYVVTLYLPIQGEAPEGARIVMGGTAYEQRVEAKQRFITARVARKVRNYATTVALAFTKFEEDGNSSVYTVEDILKVYELFDDNVISACESLIETVLGLPDHLVQYITDESLMDNIIQILQNNPSFFQED